MQGTIQLFAWLIVFISVVLHRYSTESAPDPSAPAQPQPVVLDVTSPEHYLATPPPHHYDPTNKVVLFFSIPLPGHLNPLLIQGLELARRGWHVVIATNEYRRHHITSFIQKHFAPNSTATSAGGAMEFLTIGTCADADATTAYGSADSAAAAMAETTLSLGEFWAEQSREPSYPISATAIHYQLYLLHPCLYGALKRAMLKRFVLPISTSAASSSGARYRFPAHMVVDLFSFAGMDVARQFRIPFSINNADLLLALSPAILPVHDTEPGCFTGKSFHSLGDAFTERAIYPVVRVLLLHLLMVPQEERTINGLRAINNLPPISLVRHLTGRLVIVNTAWGLEYPRPIPPVITMSGPMLIEEPLEAGERDSVLEWIDSYPTDKASGKAVPVIFVSFGTLVALDERQISELISGLIAGAGSDGASTKYRVIWKFKQSLAPEIMARIQPSVQSKQLLLTDWVPSQLRVLNHTATRVFISHCGINSAHESAYYRTPMVCIPFFADQLDMGWRVQDAGMGVVLQKTEFTGVELSQWLMKVITEPSYQANADRLMHLVRATPGARGAADVLESHIRDGISHLMMREMEFGDIPYYNLDVWAVYGLVVVAFWYLCPLCGCTSRCCNNAGGANSADEEDRDSAGNNNSSSGSSSNNTAGGGGGGQPTYTYTSTTTTTSSSSGGASNEHTTNGSGAHFPSLGRTGSGSFESFPVDSPNSSSGGGGGGGYAVIRGPASPPSQRHSSHSSQSRY